MYFDSFAALLSMDGHGPYVWAAYLITLAVIAAVLWLPWRRQSVFLRQLRGELRRAQGGPKTAPPIQKEEINASGS